MIDTVNNAVQTALQLFEKGAPKQKILACLIDAAENIAGPGSASSILVLDNNGLLRNACSPRLPYDYLNAIDGLKPNALVGTCASAAATGNMVVTKDFKSDDKWAELRHLPLALGYIGAWSMPIKTTEQHSVINYLKMAIPVFIFHQMKKEAISTGSILK